METCLSLGSLIYNSKCNQIVLCACVCVCFPSKVFVFSSLDVNQQMLFAGKTFEHGFTDGHTGRGGAYHIKTSGTYSRRVTVRQVSHS